MAAVLGGVSLAHAQLTTADILGTVTDASGSVVPNAQVQVKNLGTNETRTSTTDGSGNYTVSNLQPGHYSITVTAQGFKTTNVKDLGVEAGDRARNDAHLELGNVSETINVESSTPLLQSENATVSSTVTAQAVQDLPLNGRNYVQLVQIVPGANEGPGNGLTSGGRPDDRRQSSSISVNGQDDSQNNFSIDGFDNNERVIGTSGVRPNVEGIQEISIQTNSYTAEAGRTAGAVINLVTKSGTNQFHGSAYEYFRNDVFDARQVKQNTGNKPELRQNQFGGSIGGPIFKDKTFFFGDYEGLRQVIGVTYQSTVPTIDEYNNINSIGGGSSPAALVAGGNGTPGHTIDPVALNYLKLFPAPTNSSLTNNYVVSPNKTSNSNVFDVRVDHHFNSNNIFFGRYTYNKVDVFTPQALGTQNGLQISGGRYNFSGPATDSAQQFAFDYTHIFTQNLLIDLKAAYTRINNLSLPLNYGKNADTQVGFGPNMNFNATSNVLTPISFGPFADIGDGAFVPLQDIDGTYQYAAIVNWTKGNHNLKFGASYIRRQARNLQSAFPAGQFGFNLTTDNCNPGTGYDNVNNTCNAGQTASNKQRQDNQLASSLVGAFASSNRQYNLDTPDYRSYEPSFFAQDSWKATPKLTVIYGVRYDLFTPFTEAHGHISNFDFGQALTLSAANIGQALKVANVNGVDGHAGIKVDHSNFAPRVGFAYSASPNTVVRGGYGMSFFPGNYTSNADLKNAPFMSVYAPNCISSLAYQIQTTPAALGGGGISSSALNANCANVAGAIPTFDAGLPLPAAQNINSPSLSFNAESPNFRSAMIQQFNLQVQQQFGPNVFTIGYVGSLGQHLPQTINDINVPKPMDTVTINPVTQQPFNSSTRPLNGALSNLSNVGWLVSEGITKYSALQTQFQRRFVNGLSFDANYTWGRAAGDVTGFSQEGAQGAYNADPTRIKQIDYGIQENDIQNRFALSLNYAFAQNHHFSNGLEKFALGGWQMNTITVWQSGKPVSILNSTNAGGFSNRATPINNGGSDRPNQIKSASLSSGRTLSHYFDTTAFVPQTLGTVGTAKRNSVFGPHYRHVDLSLFKDFGVTERVKIQFRAETFNISNTPSYQLTQGSGNVQLGNNLFGQVTDVDSNYTPRLIQFALKANF